MELIILVVALCLVAFPIWVIVRLHSVQKEIDTLKSQLGVHTTTPVAPLYQNTPAEEFAARVAMQPTGEMSYTPLSTIPAPVVQEPNAFFAWITEDAFMKLGALFLLIGFGWFVSYAFINNWIGPVGRISFGVLVGMLVMALGTWRITRFRHQGSVFLVLGSGIVLLTLFAARTMYEFEFLTPVIALLLMFLSVAYLALISAMHKNDKLALASLVMAGVAPQLTNTPDPSVLALMSYLLVVVLGTIWLVRLTGSHMLTLASVVMMILYSLPFLSGGVPSAAEQMGLFFSFIFAMVFFATNTISIVMSQVHAARKTHIITAGLTGIYLAMWISLVVSPDMQSLAYVFWMIVFSIGTFAVFTMTTKRVPFYMYGAISIGLLFAATAAELEGPDLTLAYTVQAAGLALVSRFILPSKVSDQLAWLFVLPVVLSLESFGAWAWRDGFLHGDFVTLLLVGFALVLVGLVYNLITTDHYNQSRHYTGPALLIIGSVYFLALVWLVLHSVLPSDLATTVSLIIYALAGLACWTIGSISGTNIVRIYGGVLLGCVALRLLLIDVWQMELIGRIVTFFVIGILLISTAFIKKPQLNNQ